MGQLCNDVFAVGMSGTVLHYDGSGWSPMQSGTVKNLYVYGGILHVMFLQ